MTTVKQSHLPATALEANTEIVIHITNAGTAGLIILDGLYLLLIALESESNE